MNDDRKIIWIDNLRALSTIAVILLHTSAQMTYSFGKIPNSEWWASNLYQSLTRFSVPVFMMLTGVLTLGQNYTLSFFLKKKLTRILIPFIFWSFIYILYSLLKIYYKTPEVLNIEFIIEFIFKKLAFGADYHMWYVYMLISIYLIHPIINKWILNSQGKEQLYFLSLCIITLFIKSSFLNIFDLILDLSFFSIFLGYLVAGFFLFNKSIKKTRKNIIVFIALYFLSYLLICFNTYYASVGSSTFVEKYKPWDTLQAISVFLIFKTLLIFNTKNKLATLISKYSFGIYLIHVLIMELTAKMGLAYYSFNPYLSIPITTICVLVISLIILYLLDKLPLGKYIVK